ncbi:nitroreductase family protein [Paenibacillus fonticola]|uniref:nitroreductase family protein n=1 Tax=Paenibacillus fonticola TaxID=379896 RepID=UPI00036DE261|nr:nitroreductase family protein [Paenibacillus fonticola]
MDVLSSIEQRREITQFKDTAISQDILDKLIRSLYLAPSGNNLPSREFILVTKRGMLEQLSTTTPYMKWLAGAGAGVVITGNPGLSKYWLQDASIAGGFLWLTAVSYGLGAAWGAVYHSEDMAESVQRESHVRSLLHIPEDMRVVAVIGLGYPAAAPEPKKSEPLQAVFHQESYGGEQV